jgi:hypothetical protein
MSPDLARRLGWSGSAVRLFFPEMNIQFMEIKGRAQKARYQTFEELPDEDQRFILDLETREINDPDFPLSPLKMELSGASKKFSGDGKSAVK